MRAVGTGTHPEGRYLEGQVFDLPELTSGSSDTPGAPSIEDVHPDYRSIIENGWATLLDPVDDPGRTDSQIAASIVRHDDLSHPLDAAKAAEMGPEVALAIVHTGDPEATEVPDPHDERGSTLGRHGQQVAALPQGFIPGTDPVEAGTQAAGRPRGTRKTGTARKSGAAKKSTARRTTRPSARSKSGGGTSNGTTGSSDSTGGTGTSGPGA